jgi:hypothetical protein
MTQDDRIKELERVVGILVRMMDKVVKYLENDLKRNETDLDMFIKMLNSYKDPEGR